MAKIQHCDIDKSQKGKTKSMRKQKCHQKPNNASETRQKYFQAILLPKILKPRPEKPRAGFDA